MGENLKTLFLVTRSKGQAWDERKPMNGQAQWPEHAQFMNQLALTGFVVLGGPVGESGNVLLVVDAVDIDEIETTLARDSWSQTAILALQSIQRWTILLESE